MDWRCPSCQKPATIRRPANASETRLAGKSATIGECPDCGPFELSDDADGTLTFLTTDQQNAARRLEHFELIRELGRGSFGSVWLARDVSLDRDVAIKLPVSTGVESASLLHEAQAAASLRHPNIVRVYEVGTDNGQPFIASEYIAGLTLRDRMSTGRLSQSDSIALMIPVARALHHAHEAGIVHRDVKPGNIIVTDEGQPFVTDFGLAKRLSTDASITGEGEVLGTAKYMAPEQALGRSSDVHHQADIYALGVILFELLTGEVPFRGTIQAILHQKINEEAPSARTLSTSLPRDLDTICQKCLERDPLKRYATAAEVADELERVRAGQPILARPVSRAEQVWRWCRRRPAVAGLLAGLMLSLSVGMASVTLLWKRAESTAESTRRALYRSQMNLIAASLRQGDALAARQSLDRFLPQRGVPDLRGFEWHYFDAVLSHFGWSAHLGDAVQDVSVSHDGALAAACGVAGDLTVWDTSDDSILMNLSRTDHKTRCISFAPHSELLAAGNAEGEVRVWDLQQGRRPRQTLKHGPPVRALAFAPDGRSLVSVGRHGAARIWSVDDGSLLAELPAGVSGAADICFSPDSKRLAIASQDGQLRLWNIADQTLSQRFDEHQRVERIAFSDDGRLLVSGNFAGELRVWSVDTGELQLSQATGLGLTGDLEFLPQTQLLAMVGTTGVTIVYDCQTQSFVRVLPTHNLSRGALSRSGDGRRLAVGSGDGSIKLLNLEHLAQPDAIRNEGHIRHVAFLPQQHRIVCSDHEGQLRFWNLNDLEQSEPLRVADREVRHMVLRHGSEELALSVAGEGIHIWDLQARARVAELSFPGTGVSSLARGQREGLLAVGGQDGRLWTYKSGAWDEPAIKLDLGQSPIVALQYTSDEQTLAVGLQDGKIERLDSLQRQQPAAPLRIDGQPSALSWCESDKVLAVTNDLGELYLFESETDAIRVRTKAHSGRINALCVFPDGRTLVTAGRDRELKLWDVASGELITTLRGHSRQVFGLAVSPDAQTIVSCSLSGTVRVWRAHEGSD